VNLEALHPASSMMIPSARRTTTLRPKVEDREGQQDQYAAGDRRQVRALFVGVSSRDIGRQHSRRAEETEETITRLS